MNLPTPGTVLAEKYTLGEVLGEGGFGLVCRGSTIATGRPVAVKLLKPTSEKFAATHGARFLREMKTVAQLQSPHTMTLYDFGRTSEDVLFMVCEFIEGEDLLQLLLRRGQLREYEVVHILRQVLIALAEAHDLGVLHRDIKPANIRLTEYGGDPLFVKVLDFGLAKSWKMDDEDALTRSGKVIGTPRYMSPEQLAGFQLTPASDLFSLGLLTVEMLLGRDSIARENRADLNLAANAQVSPALAHVVGRMIAVDVSARYRTAAEALADLQAMRTPTMGDMPARPPKPRPAAPEEPPPTRGWVGPVVLMAVVALIAIGAMMFGRSDTETPTRTSRVLPPSLSVAEPPAAEPKQQPAPVEVEHPDLGSGDAESVSAGPCPGYPTLAPGAQTVSGLNGLSADGVLVAIPEGYDPSTKWGLILVFADVGRRAAILMDVLQVEGLSATEMPYVIAIFEPTHGLMRRWTPAGAGKALEKLTYVLENVCVDLERVFAMGRGNGALPVIHAAKHANIRAVAVSDFRQAVSDELATVEVPVLSIDDRYDMNAGPGDYPFLQRYFDFFKSHDPALRDPPQKAVDAGSTTD